MGLAGMKGSVKGVILVYAIYQNDPIVRRGKVSVFSECDSHPATQSLQPVAIGAAVEETKPPEPSMQRAVLAAPRVVRP